MRPLRPAIFLATAIFVTVGIMGLSDAHLARPAGDSLVGHVSEPVPAPVTGDNLFLPTMAKAESPSLHECISADAVLIVLALDVEQVGGRIFMMSDGVQQDFSDYWRRLVGSAPAEVSVVLAHLVPGRGGEPIVDVVEIGNDGCALSRTLLSATDWLDLIEQSEGIEV